LARPTVGIWNIDQVAHHESARAGIRSRRGTLSGGEKRRVALCRALLARPDFLILDEPTNHLDTGSIEWLEDFLARYAGTCLFVTHDRYFLDRVATRIVELSRGQFTSYDGNYTDYLLARAQRQAVEECRSTNGRRFLKRELQWVRKAPRARRTKSVGPRRTLFRDGAQEAPEAELDVELIIPTPPKLANRIIELRDVSVELGGRTSFQHVNLNLAAGERLGVVGRNGLGKSSLLKVILQELPAASGAVEIGARTQINYVDQNRLLLDDEKTVWEEVGSGGEHVTLGEQSITLARVSAAIPFQRRPHQHQDFAAQRRRTQPGVARQNPEARRERLDARRTDQRSRSRNVAPARGSTRRFRRLRHRRSVTIAIS
jgi:ATP-binding cassette subfamily F protein uup